MEPGRSVWADMEVMIDPLTIIITDNMSFISEVPILLEPIDATTSEKIDSGIVSATIDLDIENAIPLNGSIDMIISNSQHFPPCLDTLISGSMSDQISTISNSCAEYLYSKHSPEGEEGQAGPEEIIVQSRSDYNFYYIEFIDPTSDDTTFFGKFLNMSLVLPDDINANQNENNINIAIVGMPNVGKSSLMNAILKEDKQYLRDKLDDVHAQLPQMLEKLGRLQADNISYKSQIDSLTTEKDKYKVWYQAQEKMGDSLRKDLDEYRNVILSFYKKYSSSI